MNTILTMLISPSRELVLKKLRDCFLDSQAAVVLSILDQYSDRERERVQLAILMQCDSDLDRLQQLVDLAHRDYRDALVGAEYLEEFPAPRNTPPDEMRAIRERDRARYEAWLRSGKKSN